MRRIKQAAAVAAVVAASLTASTPADAHGSFYSWGTVYPNGSDTYSSCTAVSSNRVSYALVPWYFASCYEAKIYGSSWTTLYGPSWSLHAHR